VAPEPGLVALARATRACTISELDAVNGDRSAVLVHPRGRLLRISGSAALLVQAVHAGDTPDVIAARCGASVEALDRAAHDLAARIASAFHSPSDERIPGFLAHRMLFSSERTTRWASRMTWMFDRRVGPVLALAAIAIVIAARSADADAQLSPFALWAGFGLSVVVMFVHELGHAAACRAFGAPVGPIGCAIYLVYPALYCDVTHTWSLPRRARLVVDLGGVYLQMIGTAVVAVLWWATGAPVLLAATRISVAMMAMNLLPIGRFDGYWVLSDVLGIINLRAQQRRLVIAAWSRLSGRQVAPLPWSWWVSLMIGAYGIVSVWFVSTIALRFLPHVLAELWCLPERLVAAANAERVADAAASLGRVASSIIIAVIAALLVRNLARSAVALIREAVRHVRQASSPPAPRSD